METNDLVHMTQSQSSAEAQVFFRELHGPDKDVSETA